MDKTFVFIEKEEKRQKETLALIPSENYVSDSVRKAASSIFMNKYAEGYPEERYYQGNKYVDEVENYAIDRAKKLFGAPHANVQPYSGTPANIACLFALAEEGDKICGLKLSAGGHLTHGHPKITFSGKYFDSVQYDVDKEGRINYKKLEELVKKEKPKVIFAGTTAYPFKIDFERFGKIADSVGAYLVTDISHIAGMVVKGEHQSPVNYAHVVTTTTHKTLRGPRGAIIMATSKGLQEDTKLPEKIDRAVFPGIQGGPHVNTIAAIAVALKEAYKSSFKDYIKDVVTNSKTLAESLEARGFKVFGTENHLMLLDFSNFGGGSQMAIALEEAGIVVNKNTIPKDKYPPLYPSGVRLGTPAVTTRGLEKKDMEKIAGWIKRVFELVKDERLPDEKEERKKFLDDFSERIKGNEDIRKVRKEVKMFLKDYPLFHKKWQ